MWVFLCMCTFILFVCVSVFVCFPGSICDCVCDSIKSVRFKCVHMQAAQLCIRVRTCKCGYNTMHAQVKSNMRWGLRRKCHLGNDSGLFFLRFNSPEETMNVIWLRGESSASTVWCLRRRIRCNVGAEISIDRWSIYSSKKFDKPSQIDMEAGCTMFSFLTLLPTD